MSLYAIGDLHLSLGASRPMDVFEGWQNYVDRLRENWCECVRGGDTVVLLGDISWADSLEQAKEDFAFVDALPGRKIILKGNHDYWWNTRTKMCEWMAANGFSGFDFLHNNCFESCGVSVCACVLRHARLVERGRQCRRRKGAEPRGLPAARFTAKRAAAK